MKNTHSVRPGENYQWSVHLTLPDSKFLSEGQFEMQKHVMEVGLPISYKMMDNNLGIKVKN